MRYRIRRCPEHPRTNVAITEQPFPLQVLPARPLCRTNAGARGAAVRLTSSPGPTSPRRCPAPRAPRPAPRAPRPARPSRHGTRRATLQVVAGPVLLFGQLLMALGGEAVLGRPAVLLAGAVLSVASIAVKTVVELDAQERFGCVDAPATGPPRGCGAVRAAPPPLPYKVDTSRPSSRTNRTRLVPPPTLASRRARGAAGTTTTRFRSRTCSCTMCPPASPSARTPPAGSARVGPGARLRTQLQPAPTRRPNPPPARDLLPGG